MKNNLIGNDFFENNPTKVLGEFSISDYMNKIIVKGDKTQVEQYFDKQLGSDIKPEKQTSMEKSLNDTIKNKFKHLSNQKLIDRANNAPDFKWDDEEYELNRRKEASNGKFNYKMEGSKLVIIPAEETIEPTTKKEFDYSKPLKRSDVNFVETVKGTDTKKKIEKFEWNGGFYEWRYDSHSSGGGIKIYKYGTLAQLKNPLSTTGSHETIYNTYNNDQTTDEGRFIESSISKWDLFEKKPTVEKLSTKDKAEIKKEIVKTEGFRVLSIEDNIKKYSSELSDNDIKAFVWYNQTLGTPMTGWEKWFIKGTKNDTIKAIEDTEYLNQQFAVIGKFQKGDVIGKLTRFTHTYNGIPYIVVRKMDGQLVIVNSKAISSKPATSATIADLKPLILTHSLYYFNGDYVPLHIYSNTDFEILKTQLELDKEFIEKEFGTIIYENARCIINYGMDCLAKVNFDAKEKAKAEKTPEYKPKTIVSRFMRVDAPMFQDRFKLNPFSEIARDTKTMIANEEGEEEERTVTEAFIDYVNSLKNSEFLLISKSQFRSIIINDYREKFPNDPEGKEKYKNTVANAQLECIRLFSNFCTDILSTETKTLLNRLINLTYNRSILINTSKVPVGFICSSKFGLFDFILKPVQVEAFKFAVSRNNWCLALTVGFGKTSLCVALLSYYISSGALKKPLIVVPKTVLTNWLKEMNGYYMDPITKTVSFVEKPNYTKYYGIYTGCDFEIINLKNLDKRHRKLAPEVEKKKTVITLCTYEALSKLYIGDEGLRAFVIEEWKTILSGEREQTARTWAKEMLTLESALNKVDREADIDIQALGFDSMFVDEAHRLKNMFVSVTADKTNKVSSSFKGSSSSRALRGFYISMYLQKIGGRIGFLTATPFSNTPLEVYTMLCFLGYSELSKNNVNKIAKFVELFFNETTEPAVNKDNKLIYQSVMKNYKNKPILNTLLCNTFLYKDDPTEAGINRPCPIRYPRGDMKLMLRMSEVQKMQRDLLVGNMEAVQTALLNTTDEQLKLYAQDLLHKYSQNVLTVAPRSRGGSIVASSKISALSPFAGSPVALSFLTEERWSELYYNSPKIRFTVDAIANIMQFHKERQESNSSVLVYCEVGLNILPYFKEALENICGFKKRISVKEDEDDEKEIFDEVEIIEGSATSDKEQNRRDAVCKLFNMGKIKVVIGTSTIKEGLNLQNNCPTLFILTPSWNSTDINQVEGRIHRQGNRFGYARIITPVVARTLDSFIYEKYDQKKSRLADIWKNDGTGDTEDLNIEIKAEKQKELILNDAVEIAKIRADMNGLKKVNIYNKSKEDYEAVRNAIAKSGTFTELASYHLDKTAAMLKVATTNLTLIKELAELIKRDKKKEEEVPTMVRRVADRLEKLIEYYTELIELISHANSSKEVKDIVNILNRSYNQRSYFVSDIYNVVLETKEYMVKNKYKISEVENLFETDIFAKVGVFTKDTKEGLTDMQKAGSLMELKKLFGASMLAEKYILNPEGLSLTSPIEKLQELVERYKSTMESLKNDLKVNFKTNVRSDEDQDDNDDEDFGEDAKFIPKKEYLEKLQKEAQKELDEENKLARNSEELGNFFANESNVQLTYLKDDVDLTKCEIKKEACCDTNDFKKDIVPIIESVPETFTTKAQPITDFEARNKILNARLKLLAKMLAKTPSNTTLKTRIKIVTKMLEKKMFWGGPVKENKNWLVVFTRTNGKKSDIEIGGEKLQTQADVEQALSRKPDLGIYKINSITQLMRAGGPIRPKFATKKDQKYFNEAQAHERRYANEHDREKLTYNMRSGGPVKWNTGAGVDVHSFIEGDEVYTNGNHNPIGMVNSIGNKNIMVRRHKDGKIVPMAPTKLWVGKNIPHMKEGGPVGKWILEKGAWKNTLSNYTIQEWGKNDEGETQYWVLDDKGMDIFGEYIPGLKWAKGQADEYYKDSQDINSEMRTGGKVGDENPLITITEDYYDERGDNSKNPPLKYSVNYTITFDNGEFIELTGSLKPYHTGRDYDYEFEVDYFADKEEEEYYDENSEKIENEILDKFYKMRTGGPIRPKFAHNKDKKYFNAAQAHERDYAKAHGRKKLVYNMRNGGPVGNFEIELASVINPDDYQRTQVRPEIKPSKVKASSLQNAREIALNFISENDLGGGNWNGGKIWKDKKSFAYMSYNGRLWEWDGSKIEFEKPKTEILLKHGGPVEYADLSKVKPQIVNDSVISSVPEIDIVKVGLVKFEGKNKISSSETAVKIFREFWSENNINVQEHFNVLLLNRSNRPIGIYQHSKGGINATIADIEIISAVAIKALAKGVIVAHNHPSGEMSPSEEDKNMTKRLKEALKLFDVSLLDSLILAPNQAHHVTSYYSFLDEGIMRDGGPVDNEEIDLFEHYEDLPENVQEILNKYSSEEGTYENLEQLLAELEPLGYTFEYDLDAVPYGLKKIT